MLHFSDDIICFFSALRVLANICYEAELLHLSWCIIFRIINTGSLRRLKENDVHRDHLAKNVN